MTDKEIDKLNKDLERAKKFIASKGGDLVFLINPLDIADYLATADISLQEVFGVSYVEDFLGMGTVIINGLVPKGTIYATPLNERNKFGSVCIKKRNIDVREHFEKINKIREILK